MRHNKLGYVEYRQLEDLIKAHWNGHGYRHGATDSTLAELATRKLNQVIKASNILFVRQAIGLHEATKKLTARVFTQEALTRLEERLLAHGKVTVTYSLQSTGPHITVYEVDTYLRHREVAKRTKPWAKRHEAKKAPAAHA